MLPTRPTLQLEQGLFWSDCDSTSWRYNSIAVNNLPLYKRIIELYEANTLRIEGDNIYINDSLATTYTFKQNYYWMMGDNRDNSQDSRFWGFVPEDHIVGKAMIIWFSSEQNKSFPSNIRWSRMFNVIHKD